MTSWPADFFNTHPAFATIAPFLAQFDCMPDEARWASVVSGAYSASGLPIRFVPNDQISVYYELAVYQFGEVATRLNWHDTFNAMVWHAFPRSKSALNAMHHRIITANPGQTQRGSARDAATLFDECGLVLPYSKPELLDLLITHQWQQLFIEHRGAWGTQIAAMSFGHANYENLLAPFLGLTGKCWPILVEPDFFTLAHREQLAVLDEKLSQLIASDWLQRPKQLPALPYLGIPGWFAEQDNAFYANTQYFRTKRVVAEPA
jgi:hypothetical protein